MLERMENICRPVDRVLRDESGIETGEWLVILAVVTTVAIAVFGTTAGGPLGTALTGVITSITTALTGV